MEAALYDPERGFYATAVRAGRRGDFITSPEVGPLFGAVTARAIDAWWCAAGEPDRLTVVEAGAGPGTWARSVLAAEPACKAALRYVLVERSAVQRAAHRDRGLAGVESRADLPAVEGPCIVLANELLDNLPFDLAERTPGGWADVRVVEEGGRLVEVLVPTDAEPLERLAPEATVGARIPVQRTATSWLRAALDLSGPGGRVVVIDYASTTAAMAERPAVSWLRTYRGHERGGPPLTDLGRQDITCEVAADQLAAVHPPARERSQAEWLREHGIDELVEAGRRTWAERAHLGDLEAVRARSRITEAEALLDPAGLGGFRVLEWLP
ncbi:MAG: SAM-dependent methyltransferase [Acidimicrobiales bacterium]|nr:SAM-dependent methyltransferase [Acidimicrobiales bacterium]